MGSKRHGQSFSAGGGDIAFRDDGFISCWWLPLEESVLSIEDGLSR